MGREQEKKKMQQGFAKGKEKFTRLKQATKEAKTDMKNQLQTAQKLYGILHGDSNIGDFLMNERPGQYREFQKEKDQENEEEEDNEEEGDNHNPIRIIIKKSFFEQHDK